MKEVGYQGALFSPIKLGTLSLRNRIVMAPMATGFGTYAGQVTDRLIRYYAERAKGGVGLIVTEGNAVAAEGRSGINRLGLYDDNQIAGHKKLTESLHALGTPVSAQLHHAGGVASLKVSGQYPLSCSTVPFLGREDPGLGIIPRTLSKPEVNDLSEKFSQAAVRAKESGYDAVMVHAGHGYLLHQFLSSRKNRRQDQYGGTEQNRARFLIEIVEHIRRKVGPAFPIQVRLPAAGHPRGECTTGFIQKLACWLESLGVSEISISAGSKPEGEEKTFPSAALAEGFLSIESKRLKRFVNLPVGVVGRIMSVSTAEIILEQKKADLIYLGRPLIADPDFALKVKQGREEFIRPCIVCNKCIDSLRTGSSIRCSVNPVVGQETPESSSRVKNPKKIVVVGGGPAGMEAARTAAIRGHKVLLFEASNRLGGNLKNAMLCLHKEQISKLMIYYINALRSLGVAVSLEKELTSKSVEELRPDVLVLATGAEPILPEVVGSKLKHVLLAEDFLRNPSSIGSKVAVIGGGMIGLEVADLLAEKGKSVIVIEQLDSIGRGTPAIARKELVSRLCEKSVKILVSTRAIAIGRAGVLVEHSGERSNISANSVIVASGYHPRTDLAENLDLLDMDFYVIGDCLQPRTIFEAIEEGYRIGCTI